MTETFEMLPAHRLYESLSRMAIRTTLLERPVVLPDGPPGGTRPMALPLGDRGERSGCQ